MHFFKSSVCKSLNQWKNYRADTLNEGEDKLP